jgi:hypothetical protein
VRHDDEGGIAASVHGRLEAIDHLLCRHQLLARTVTAALGGHLVLEVHAAGAGADQLTRGARDVERTAEAGVGIDQKRQLARPADAAHVLAHVVERGHPQVRQSEGRIGHARARQIEGAEPGAPGEQRRIGVDRSDDL